jgi:hypothetical protein
MEKIDWQAVWAWAKNPDRRPPELAFTAGPERKAADIAWFVMLRERDRCVGIAESGIDGVSIPSDASASLIARKIRGTEYR